MEDPQFHNILFTWVDFPNFRIFVNLLGILGISTTIPLDMGGGKGTDTPMNIADHGDIGWNQFD